MSGEPADEVLGADSALRKLLDAAMGRNPGLRCGPDDTSSQPYEILLRSLEGDADHSYRKQLTEAVLQVLMNGASKAFDVDAGNVSLEQFLLLANDLEYEERQRSRLHNAVWMLSQRIQERGTTKSADVLLYRAHQCLVSSGYRGDPAFWMSQYNPRLPSTSHAVLVALRHLGLRYMLTWLRQVEITTQLEDAIINQVRHLLKMGLAPTLQLLDGLRGRITTGALSRAESIIRAAGYSLDMDEGPTTVAEDTEAYASSWERGRGENLDLRSDVIAKARSIEKEKYQAKYARCLEFASEFDSRARAWGNTETLEVTLRKLKAISMNVSEMSEEDLLVLGSLATFWMGLTISPRGNDAVFLPNAMLSIVMRQKSGALKGP